MLNLTVEGRCVPGETIRMEVGTDQAEGVLRGAPVTVTVDEHGNIAERTLTPCGVTTHVSTETDFTCKVENVEREQCRNDQIGTWCRRVEADAAAQLC
ncbi:hypothetical protein ACFCX3_06025 [Streptomyces virginiae]|uniref:hypothetical protein n=1 Tax=Streptomyces virginiae TaxID=1961 RepID=UPI0035E0300E